MFKFNLPLSTTIGKRVELTLMQMKWCRTEAGRAEAEIISLVSLWAIESLPYQTDLVRISNSKMGKSECLATWTWWPNKKTDTQNKNVLAAGPFTALPLWDFTWSAGPPERSWQHDRARQSTTFLVHAGFFFLFIFLFLQPQGRQAEDPQRLALSPGARAHPAAGARHRGGQASFLQAVRRLRFWVSNACLLGPGTPHNHHNPIPPCLNRIE